MFSAFAYDMEALALKEDAQQLQAMGHFEAALQLMLKSVDIREHSHTLCLSLSELGELYLDMRMFSRAEAAAHRMLDEAGRFDTAQQIRIAEEILEHIGSEREHGLEHGAAVRLRGLTRRPELNGKGGIVRGKHRESGRFYIDVGASRLLILRKHLAVPVEDLPADGDENPIQSAIE